MDLVNLVLVLAVGGSLPSLPRIPHARGIYIKPQVLRHAGLTINKHLCDLIMVKQFTLCTSLLCTAWTQNHANHRNTKTLLLGL